MNSNSIYFSSVHAIRFISKSYSVYAWKINKSFAFVNEKQWFNYLFLLATESSYTFLKSLLCHKNLYRLKATVVCFLFGTLNDSDGLLYVVWCKKLIVYWNIILNFEKALNINKIIKLI